MTPYVVVGAGFTGAVIAERIASQLGEEVLLVDRRNHVAGNAFDMQDEHGVLIHKHGAHSFHTSSAKIWEYLSQFTQWRPYELNVLGSVDGQLVPVPFNLNSLEQLFPRPQAEFLERKLVARYGPGTKVPVLRMLEETDPDLANLASFIYRNIFEGYTLKQWGASPKQLDPSVTGRVPVVISRDNRYFQDVYQGIPLEGYTRMFHRMLDHPKIHLSLNTDYRDLDGQANHSRLIYTGPIDEYFHEMHGPLPYRSLRFEWTHSPQEFFQPSAIVTYPNQHTYTRCIEFKHITGQQTAGTTFTREFPEPYVKGQNEAYYPIPQPENRERYALYLEEAAALAGRVYFAGRLADYKYYNMDQAVGRALKVFEEIATGEEPSLAAAASIA